MRKKAIELTEIWNKNLQAGDKLEGTYLKKEIVKTQFGDSEKYVIVKPDGTKIGVFSSASLVNQFNNVPEGSYVWIEYKGEETSKNGRPVKSYIVEYDDEVKQ
jgi:hypothetical protein